MLNAKSREFRGTQRQISRLPMIKTKWNRESGRMFEFN